MSERVKKLCTMVTNNMRDGHERNTEAACNTLRSAISVALKHEGNQPHFAFNRVADDRELDGGVTNFFFYMSSEKNRSKVLQTFENSVYKRKN